MRPAHFTPHSIASALKQMRGVTCPCGWCLPSAVPARAVVELFDLGPGGIFQGAEAAFATHQVVGLHLKVMTLSMWLVNEPLDVGLFRLFRSCPTLDRKALCKLTLLVLDVLQLLDRHMLMDPALALLTLLPIALLLPLMPSFDFSGEDLLEQGFLDLPILLAILFPCGFVLTKEMIGSVQEVFDALGCQRSNAVVLPVLFT